MTHWFLFTDPPYNVFITTGMINICHEQPRWGAVYSPWGCFLVFLLHCTCIAICPEEWSGIRCPGLQLCLQTQFFIVILGKSCSSSRSLSHLQNERDGLDNFLSFIWCRHFSDSWFQVRLHLFIMPVSHPIKKVAIATYLQCSQTPNL